MVERKIVCLGGGVGTANLLSGLKSSFSDIRAIVSMADDGGSAGRLRRFFKVPPPGDIVNCMIALSDAESTMLQLLKYRFRGNRYGADSAIPGQKLGNLLFVALTDITGDFANALAEMQRLFKIHGKIYPATREDVSIWAQTTEEKVDREENIDRGKFKGTIEKVHISPTNPHVDAEVVSSILNADVIIAGPGDLYTTILPVIIIPTILSSLKKAKAKKIFVVNVANKSNETPGYTLDKFISAIEKHAGSTLFDTFLINDNTSIPIERKWRKQYSYVVPSKSLKKGVSVVQADVVNPLFPLYHSAEKLAKVVKAHI